MAILFAIDESERTIEVFTDLDQKFLNDSGLKHMKTNYIVNEDMGKDDISVYDYKNILYYV